VCFSFVLFLITLRTIQTSWLIFSLPRVLECFLVPATDKRLFFTRLDIVHFSSPRPPDAAANPILSTARLALASTGGGFQEHSFFASTPEPRLDADRFSSSPIRRARRRFSSIDSLPFRIWRLPLCQLSFGPYAPRLSRLLCLTA